MVDFCGTITSASPILSQFTTEPLRSSTAPDTLGTPCECAGGVSLRRDAPTARQVKNSTSRSLRVEVRDMCASVCCAVLCCAVVCGWLLVCFVSISQSVSQPASRRQQAPIAIVPIEIDCNLIHTYMRTCPSKHANSQLTDLFVDKPFLSVRTRMHKKAARQTRQQDSQEGGKPGKQGNKTHKRAACTRRQPGKRGNKTHKKEARTTCAHSITAWHSRNERLNH